MSSFAVLTSQSCITGCPEITLNKGVITGDLHTAGSELTFTCDENYKEVEDKSYTVCESTGSWSYVPRCITGKTQLTPCLTIASRHSIFS